MELMAQPFSLLIYFGLILKCAGFFLRDEMLLRLLVAGGMAADMAFYALQTPPILPSVLANVILVAINIALIVVIVFERTQIGMKPDDRALFRHFKTLSPGQFRRILRDATQSKLESERVLVSEGRGVDTLYFVEAHQYDIVKQGVRYPAKGPAFVGEVAFLTNQPSSADVSVPAGASIVGFDIGRLRQMMRKSASLENGMVALFGDDLARKVAKSVPMG